MGLANIKTTIAKIVLEIRVIMLQIFLYVLQIVDLYQLPQQ